MWLFRFIAPWRRRAIAPQVGAVRFVALADVSIRLVALADVPIRLHALADVEMVH